MPLLRHPSRLKSPADWPNLWPYAMNRKSGQARDIDLWYPCNPHAPLSNLSGLIDPPASETHLNYNGATGCGDYLQIDFPFASGRVNINPVAHYSASLWVYYPSNFSVPTYNYEYPLYTIIIDYGLMYDSPNFIVYADGHAASQIHHTYDAVESPAGVLRPNAWNHLAMTFWAQKGGAYATGEHKLFVNGRNVAQINTATTYFQYGIRNRIRINSGAYGLRVRDVRFKQSLYAAFGPPWTEDEVLEQYENPFDLYEPILRRTYFIPLNDPTGVPAEYSPNLELSWVQKASYIWALHPSSPLKADKGGNTLVYSTSGVNSPTTNPDNTLSMGGESGNGKWFQSSQPFIFGDDPNTAGNQTPPVVGGCMMWVKLRNNPPGNYGRFANQFKATNPTFGLTSGGLMAAWVNNLSFHGTPLPLSQWILVGFQNNGSTRRLYLNGVMVKSDAQDSVAATSEIFEIAGGTKELLASYRIDGDIRQVAVINGANWTDADIQEMYDRAFAYYAPPIPAQHIVLDPLDSTTVLYALKVRVKLPPIQVPALASTTVLYSPIVEAEQEIILSQVSSTSVLYAPKVIQQPKVKLASLTSTALLYSIQVKTPVMFEIAALESTTVLGAIRVLQVNRFPTMVVTTITTSVQVENRFIVSTSMPEMNAVINDLVQGDSRSVRAVLTDLIPGDPLDTAWLTIKDDLSDLDADAIVKKIITPSSSLLDGKIYQDQDCLAECWFSLRKTETILLIPGTPYLFDIQVRSTQGAIFTPIKGTIETIAQVTLSN